MTLAEAIANGARALEAAGFPPDESRRDAAVLARERLGWTAADLLTRQSDQVPATFDTAFLTDIARRVAREPVAYITGRREFYGRMFQVSRAVLIPRPETELLLDEALKVIDPAAAGVAAGPVRVLDIGTGSGCIAVTIALERPSAHVEATDTSAAALDVARDNALRLDAAGRIVFRLASLAGPLTPNRFDVVVSNPPYVGERDRESLPRDVRDYEPASALFAGDDGLGVIRALARAAGIVLRHGGWLLLEIGQGQADAVRQFIDAGRVFHLSHVARDLSGIERVVVARKK